MERHNNNNQQINLTNNNNDQSGNDARFTTITIEPVNDTASIQKTSSATKQLQRVAKERWKNIQSEGEFMESKKDVEKEEKQHHVNHLPQVHRVCARKTKPKNGKKEEKNAITS